MVIFDGMNGKLILPLLRPGRRNKSLNIFGILRRVIEYIHKEWPHTIIELRGDSHFCSHEFMDWVKTHLYVRFITGLLEKARGIDPFGHAGFDPSGKIRLTL